MAKPPAAGYKTHPTKKKKGSRFAEAADNSLRIWSVHPVMEALKVIPGNVSEVVVEEKYGSRISQIIELAEQNKVTIRFDNRPFQGKGMTDMERHQGVLAHVRFPYTELPAMVNDLQKDGDIPFILALDSVQDPQNLGSIIRSAVAAGCRKLILPKDRSAQITGTVAKSSAGAVFHIDICRVTNLVSAIDMLKEAGVWIFGTSVDDALSVYTADFHVPACLVIGNEEKGLRPLVKKHCDLLVTIPMFSKLNSLNVSVAAGIVLFEIARQRAQ